MRPWLTDGNIEFAKAFQQAVAAHFDRPVEETKQHDKSLQHRRGLLVNLGEYSRLQALGLTRRVPERRKLKSENGAPVDQSKFFEPIPFAELVTQILVASFRRAGPGAITTVAEALFVVNALASLHDARKLYYRGEHRYGWALESRAQRKMDKKSLATANGITNLEIEELRRFQNQVRNDPSQVEVVQSNALPNDDDPEWLPIMQHYDEDFGTRLLDVTSSIFSGLHFACVDWDGTIDFDTDGLLYVFFDEGRYYRYEEQRTGDFYDDVSEFVPNKITDSFKNWRHSNYIHHFASKHSSMRAFAQDGHFLVQGDISVEPVFGARATFKLCVPHWAKARVIEELWFAGYTPERIVRGRKGKTAAQQAKEHLQEYQERNPGWRLDS